MLFLMIEEWKQVVLELVSLAQQNTQMYPVKYNHCFIRIILDQLCQDCWYNHISKPAIYNMTNEQLSKAIELAKVIIKHPEICWVWNMQSLKWRGKI